ncbi:MAG: SIS domain-containing protein [Rhizobiaceae bacterium]
MTDSRLQKALQTVGEALSIIDQEEVNRACEIIASASRIGIYGCGREGYQMRGFAMRLFHLGLDVGYVGDTTMPPLGDGDVLVVSAGPGELATVNAHLATAQKAGAKTVFLTAEPDTAAAALADLILTIPAQTMASDATAAPDSILPMGSVYEGALFFLFELMVAELRAKLDESAESMRVRHTNME